MPTNTYVALDKVTVTTATPSITFTAINQGYTDLVVVISAPTSSDGATPQFRFNGDTTTNYSNTFLEGSGTSATSNRESNQTNIQLSFNVGGNSTNPSTSIVHIMNYANTTTFKTLLARWNSASGGTFPGTAATVGLWRKTPEAITSMEIFVATGNFAVGSTFSLYGIAAEGQGYATGGYVTSDSQYYYHTFAANGTFIPQKALSCDIMVVAGGGGGGGYVGGGGGAGGLLGFTSQALTATNYSITIGAGGAGAAAGPGDNGTAGQNSQFGALTAAVGGGYGSGYSNGSGIGGNGGSGGGGTNIGTTTGGSPTSGQGFKGGDATNGGSDYPSGGGGGAGGAGGNTSGSIAGNGGVGSSAYSSWGLATTTGHNVSGTYYYAGGGGGGVYKQNTPTVGSGGFGGGGAGGALNVNAGNSGTANTGGGGGGATSNSGATKRAGGNGGSGIVIVRYAK
jgi:hypothetical protein